MVGGFWRIDANRKASIYLRNALESSPIAVAPSLYLSNGTRYRLAPVTLEPSGTAVASINESLRLQGIPPWATLSGYVEVEYTWAWDPVCVTVTSVDPVDSVIFGLRAPAVFSDHRLQRFFVQTQIRNQLSQLRVLVTQLLSFLRLAYVHSTVLRFPGVERVLGHPHFTRHVFHLPSCLHLLQRPDHLRLRVPALRHTPFPFLSLKSYSALCENRGAGHFRA